MTIDITVQAVLNTAVVIYIIHKFIQYMLKSQWLESNVLTEKVPNTSESVTNTFVSESCQTRYLYQHHGGSSFDSQFDIISDEQVANVLSKLRSGSLKTYQLEQLDRSGLADTGQAVQVRREWLIAGHPGMRMAALKDIPFRDYNYNKVYNQSCEQVVGYLPLPLGVAGPLKINSRTVFIPLATTEGGLVASVNRGCKAVSSGGLGVSAFVYDDGMTRAPVMRCRSAKEAVMVVEWINKPVEVNQEISNFCRLKTAFDASSRGGHANLLSIKAIPAGKLLYLRFKAKTGEAMGMNMVSKGVNAALAELKQHFPSVQLESISGNVCSDKKAAAINWIEGRGKSVVVESTVTRQVVETVLRTTVGDMVRLNISKNLVGSAMAGSLGGFNCHSANIVSALFLATGQDAAQVGTSSMCLTYLEATERGDLYASCTMPCIEVGTIGGGTVLPAQLANLQILGCAASISDKMDPAHQDVSKMVQNGENSMQLAKIIASTVLAGELNLLAELCQNTLVTAHMRLNRSHAKLADAVKLIGPTTETTNSCSHVLPVDDGGVSILSLGKRMGNPECSSVYS